VRLVPKSKCRDPVRCVTVYEFSLLAWCERSLFDWRHLGLNVLLVVHVLVWLVLGSCVMESYKSWDRSPNLLPSKYGTGGHVGDAVDYLRCGAGGKEGSHFFPSSNTSMRIGNRGACKILKFHLLLCRRDHSCAQRTGWRVYSCVCF